MSKLEPTRTCSNPTANNILRRMLDERGVEYTEDRGYREFFWDFGESGRARASAIGTKGLVQMIVTGITPEQAIAATLGDTDATGERQADAETCHIDLVGYNQHEDRFQCRSCDWSMWFKRGTWPRFNYCPNCGRRIEQ